MLTDNRPVPPDMHVTLSSEKRFDSQIATVAQDGSLDFRGLAKGVYSIAFGMRGYKPKDGFYGEVLINGADKTIVVPLSPELPR